MSNRQDQEREKRLQPIRISKAITEIENLGYKVTEETSTRISFHFKGHKINYFPYSGWASGKTIIDGRGLKNLLAQIKK